MATFGAHKIMFAPDGVTRLCEHCGGAPPFAVGGCSNNPDPVPKFSLNSSDDDLLRKVIPLVNYMLDEHPLDRRLWSGIEPQKLRRSLSELSVRFCPSACCYACQTKNVSGHTVRGRGVKVIYLNPVLKQRYAKRERGVDERTRILFFMGVTVYHELAHVLLRWSGRMNSPAYCVGENGDPEAGYFSERLAWGGFVHMELDISGRVGKKRKSTVKLTSELPVCGILLHVNGNHYKRLEDSYLRAYVALPDQLPKLECKVWHRKLNRMAMKGGSHDDVRSSFHQGFSDRNVMLFGGCMCT